MKLFAYVFFWALALPTSAAIAFWVLIFAIANFGVYGALAVLGALVGTLVYAVSES